jgi:hypothetical protein
VRVRDLLEFSPAALCKPGNTNIVPARRRWGRRKKERTRASKSQGNRQANLVGSQPFSLTGEISPKTEIKNKIK